MVTSTRPGWDDTRTLDDEDVSVGLTGCASRVLLGRMNLLDARSFMQILDNV